MVLLVLFLVGVLSVRADTKGFLAAYGRKIFYGALILGAGVGIYNSLLQHFVWSQGELTKFLTTLYQPDYFYFYVLMRIWAPYLISLAVSLLVIGTLALLNKRHAGRLLEENEHYLAGLVIFIVGHPGWLVYLTGLISIYLLWHLYNFASKRAQERLPLFGLWAWIGVLTILVDRYFLIGTPLWSIFKI